MSVELFDKPSSALSGTFSQREKDPPLRVSEELNSYKADWGADSNSFKRLKRDGFCIDIGNLVD